MNLDGLKIALVGPMPPPEGGMANQTRQLAELLAREGARVDVVRVNAPYRPRWVAGIRGIRAACRLVPYVIRLWNAAGRADVFHVMANSGWSWHLFAAPAVWVAHLRAVPCIVNYRGGEAEAFLAQSGSKVSRTLRRARALVVPSGFLQQVFERWGLHSEVVPNIVDTERFRPPASATGARPPHLVVARNLEPIYDVPTALRSFALVREAVPEARLTVAGDGPERDRLESLAASLGIAAAVDFRGRLDRDRMADLYRSAAVVLNSSRVDNMPNSILEAMASGAPVISTDVGGVPFILRDGATGLLVAAGDFRAMADAAKRVLTDRDLAERLRDAGLAEAQRYTWPRLRQAWVDTYESALSRTRAEPRPA